MPSTQALNPPSLPELAYEHLRDSILEGTLEYHLDGQPPLTVTAGEALTVPAETVHAVRNVGSGNAAELATYFVEKGKPFLVVVD